jgi:hypothetical protein
LPGIFSVPGNRPFSPGLPRRGFFNKLLRNERLVIVLESDAVQRIAAIRALSAFAGVR